MDTDENDSNLVLTPSDVRIIQSIKALYVRRSYKQIIPYIKEALPHLAQFTTGDLLDAIYTENYDSWKITDELYSSWKSSHKQFHDF